MAILSSVALPLLIKEFPAGLYCKENLQQKEVLFHNVFQKKLCLQLATEIEEYHFGCSKKEATLQVGVLVWVNQFFFFQNNMRM